MPAEPLGAKARRIVRKDLWVTLYFFREHVDVVRRRILRRPSAESSAVEPGAAELQPSDGG